MRVANAERTGAPVRKSVILVAPLAMLALATVHKEECLKHMSEAKNRGWLGIQYEEVKSTWKSLSPASSIAYTLKRDGVSQDLTATPVKMPEEIHQAMITERTKQLTTAASD
jgi:hypothetical protein